MAVAKIRCVGMADSTNPAIRAIKSMNTAKLCVDNFLIFFSYFGKSIILDPR